MKNFDLENIDCHATLGMIEKRWGFPRRTLRALLRMTKSGQSGRSLLPESGADAPTVLSAVYTGSTPAKNRQADVPQYGRSMIEMLGVLAIIGVLSVGGIAGYSKAMTKYRINKTIEQITLIAGNIRSFFAPQKNYVGVRCVCYNGGCEGQTAGDGCPVIKKAKILPDEIITLNNVGEITAITNALGYPVEVNDDMGNFMIDVYVGDNSDACIELATYDWSIANVENVGIYQLDNSDDADFTPPVSVEDAVEACSHLSIESESYISFYFRS